MKFLSTAHIYCAAVRLQAGEDSSKPVALNVCNTACSYRPQFCRNCWASIPGSTKAVCTFAGPLSVSIWRHYSALTLQWRSQLVKQERCFCQWQHSDHNSSAGFSLDSINPTFLSGASNSTSVFPHTSICWQPVNSLLCPQIPLGKWLQSQTGDCHHL